MTAPDATLPELGYVLHVIPPGRFPFRRWRWELWRGPTLLATGWRTSERQAEQALRTAASRAMHRHAGLHPLRPDQTSVPGGFRAGATALLESGGLRCMLVPLTGTPGH